MKKIRLDLDRLSVESFATERDGGPGKGTVRGHLSAYYELCHAGDTWQVSCTCEPTCNAQTCHNCSVACPSAGCPGPSALCSPKCTDFEYAPTYDPRGC